MKNNWPTKKLAEVCDFEGGSQPPKSTFIFQPKSGYIRLLQIRDFSKDKFPTYVPDSERLKKCTQDDILIGRYGASVGKILTGKSGAYNVAIIKTIPKKDKILSEYLNFFLHTNYVQDWFTSRSRSAQAGFTKEELGSLDIATPDLAEQKKVVKKIEGLFAKIEEAQKLREESKKESSNLLQSALNEVFSHTKNQKALSEVSEINPKNDTKNLPDNSEVSFIPMRYVDDIDGAVTQKDVKKLSEVRKGFTNFKNGDVIFAKITPCMENGKVALVKDLTNGIGFGSTEFHVIRSKGQVLPELIYYYLRRQVYRDEAEQRMTGSAGQKRVPKDFLEKSMFPVFSLPEQKKIVARLDLLSTKIHELQKLQSETEKDLKDLKQSILHKAFAGELLLNSDEE
ncbi:MAG: hypothetical protein A3E98_03100 [Candidatus Doudnabacteria bacterium RIFCSPHIGHO2_12_FULL_48_11]|nr:MAG: hypothetical protein A3E98_03100 [Candidatus Doudnabacteria bacterium RIFCSPHIGHO2_12_FULL_48_11]